MTGSCRFEAKDSWRSCRGVASWSAPTRQDVDDVFWAQAMISSELAARAAKISKENPRRLTEIQSLHDQAVKDGDAGTALRRRTHVGVAVILVTFRLLPSHGRDDSSPLVRLVNVWLRARAGPGRRGWG